jgi:hypothetical protein
MAFGLSNAGNLKIFNVMMPIDQVTFDYNPESFKIGKGTINRPRAQTGAGQSGAAPSPMDPPSGYMTLFRGTEPAKVDFTALLVEESSGAGDEIANATAIGGGIKARCDLLYAWTQPLGGSLLGAAVSVAASALGFKFQKSARPPLLMLQWGDPARGFLIQGVITSLSIDYKRFDAIGNPNLARVTCGFQEAPNSLLNLLTNPTSGGVPGRRGHVMTQGETLASVATTAYGRPQAWRDVAEANGIDDPLRVLPGRRVYLPPADEITA